MVNAKRSQLGKLDAALPPQDERSRTCLTDFDLGCDRFGELFALALSPGDCAGDRNGRFGSPVPLKPVVEITGFANRG